MKCGPTGKVIFKTHEKALLRAAEFKERPLQGRHHWRAYKCVYCGGYHLTRQPPRS